MCAILRSVVQIALNCMVRFGRDLIATRMSTNARTLLNTAATIPAAPTSTDLSFAIVILGTSEYLEKSIVVSVSTVNLRKSYNYPTHHVFISQSSTTQTAQKHVRCETGKLAPKLAYTTHGNIE